MVAPIEPISSLTCSPISIDIPISHKRWQQILKKLYDEEKNYKYLSRKEKEESWEQFRHRGSKKNNTES